jgi:high-affinity iron transporter
MSAALLITFRETLEASLVVAIVLTIIDRLQRERLKIALWNGVAAGIACSIAIAVAVHVLFQSLPPHLEGIAEGVTMLVAAALIVWLVVWVTRMRGNMRQHVSDQATAHIDQGSWWGIFFMSFFAVVREGTETVLFLQASAFQAQQFFSSVAAVAGVVLAVGCTMLVFRGLHRVPLKRIFQATSALLLLFAVTLTIGGIEEIMEAVEAVS